MVASSPADDRANASVHIGTARLLPSRENPADTAETLPGDFLYLRPHP